MTLSYIHVRCECDKCGKWYDVEVDPADPRPAYDIVAEPDSTHAVADMQDFRLGEFAMFSVVQENGRMLCPGCFHNVMHMRTPQQIEELLEDREQKQQPKLIVSNKGKNYRPKNNVVMLVFDKD